MVAIGVATEKLSRLIREPVTVIFSDASFFAACSDTFCDCVTSWRSTSASAHALPEMANAIAAAIAHLLVFIPTLISL